MPSELIQQLQITVDDCRRLAALIDDSATADRLRKLADELEAHLDRAAKTGLGSDDAGDPRKWGNELDV